jgi:hypothetical protein
VADRYVKFFLPALLVVAAATHQVSALLVVLNSIANGDKPSFFHTERCRTER